MKKNTLLLAILSLTLFSVSAAPLKIGYINIDQVVSTSPQFIEASRAVIKELKPKEEKLIALKEEIESLVKIFEENKEDLSKTQIKIETKKIARLESQLKQQFTQLQQALKHKKIEELGKIEDLINQTIKQVAEEQNFDLILYKEVAYASKEINITSLISKKLRELFK